MVGVGLVLRACAACDHFLILLPCGHGVFAFPAKFGTPARRAADGGLLGAAPLLDPLCTPPGTPPKKGFQFPQSGEGNASYAAGASLTRSARSGDLPPRRVNAIARSRVGQTPFQPNTMGSFTHFVPRYSPFPRAPCLPEIQGTQEVGLPLAVLGLYPKIFAHPSHTMIARNSGHSTIFSILPVATSNTAK